MGERRTLKTQEKQNKFSGAMDRTFHDSAVIFAGSVMAMYTLNIYNQNCDLVSCEDRLYRGVKDDLVKMIKIFTFCSDKLIDNA